MKQYCHISFIYLSWAIFIGGLVIFIVKGAYILAIVWVMIAPLAHWAYIRTFPALSRYLGYGRVDDRWPENTSRVPTEVTLYTALGCPFCPLVRQRLRALQKEMGFALQEVDVTLKPDLLIAQGIRAVPVVDVQGRRIFGCATSEQLAALIRGSSSIEGSTG